MLRIRVAIPAMDELAFLPVTLDALACQQTEHPFEVYVCVNQPDDYWDDPARKVVCVQNQELLRYLYQYDSLRLHVLDFSSPGKGWKGKRRGVGFARRVLFERILSESSPEDLVVSLDADTWVGERYLHSLARRFETDSVLNAIAVPYYHPVGKADEQQSRAMLRYEIYMRNYAINLLQIKSPYGFTALGSAIAMRAGALEKIGNITPLQSGEDFYLVQKFCKMGGLSLYNEERVYPSGRCSERVPFGTGPAIAQGVNHQLSYPIYHHSVFQPIEDAYEHVDCLYRQSCAASGNDFLQFLQKGEAKPDIWANIRSNVSDFDHFVKAFHQKADGLRILQYVRARQKQNMEHEAATLYDNIRTWDTESFPLECPAWLNASLPLSAFSVSQLDELRDILFRLEDFLRIGYSQ